MRRIKYFLLCFAIYYAYTTKVTRSALSSSENKDTHAVQHIANHGNIQRSPQCLVLSLPGPQLYNKVKQAMMCATQCEWYGDDKITIVQYQNVIGQFDAIIPHNIPLKERMRCKGKIFMLQGQYNNAENIFKATLKLLESIPRDITPKNIIDKVNQYTINIYNDLGKLYLKWQNHHLSIKCLREALLLGTLQHLLGSSEIATTRYYIGKNYLVQQKYKKAIPYYIEAINVFQQEKGIQLVHSYNEIGTCFQYTQQYYKAFKAYQQIILMQKHTYIGIGIVHAVAHNVGVLYMQIKNSEKAILYLEIADKILDDVHTKNNLACAYEAAEAYDKALKAYKSVLILQKGIFKADDMRIQCTLKDIARMVQKLQHQGDKMAPHTCHQLPANNTATFNLPSIPQEEEKTPNGKEESPLFPTDKTVLDNAQPPIRSNNFCSPIVPGQFYTSMSMEVSHTHNFFPNETPCAQLTHSFPPVNINININSPNQNKSQVVQKGMAIPL